MGIYHETVGKVHKDVLEPEEWNAGHDVAGFESTGAITLSGDGLVYIEVRPDVDWATVQGQGKPTFVKRGIFGGYSLPVYSTDSEELYLGLCVPGRWDEASDIMAHVDCWLAGAEDTKNFKLQLSWEHYTEGDTVLATSNDVEVETATGASAAQYKSFRVPFIIDYDIDTLDNIVAEDRLGMRLRRIVASENDCAGEIVIAHVGVSFRRDKMGVATP